MKHDWLLIIAISLMVSAISVGIIYTYFSINNKECISNPLVYGANYYSELYNYDFVGSGVFITRFNAPIIYFNRHNITFGDR